MSNKKILLLGAGLVTRPLVKYLLDVPEFNLTIASRTVSKAEALVGGHPRGIAKSLNVKDEAALESEIQDHDLTISLLPAPMHPIASKYCLKHKKHLMTTSYVGAPMTAFNQDAKAAGLIFMNELGLDPGIDHMSAMKIIHSVADQGGKVLSFRSYCGGLPAPEANTNPFGYKFSWAPRGVLTASTNSARFLWDGELKEIPGVDLFTENHLLKVDQFQFEAYPNRDSMPYQDLYGLHDVKTMFRGTFRNLSWCVTLKAMVDLGLMDQTVREFKATTYKGMLAEVIGSDESNLLEAVSKRIGHPTNHVSIENIKWLGVFDDRPLPKDMESVVDAMVPLCIEKMSYEPGERDLIVLHHIFDVELGGDKKTITSTLIDYGIPNGDSAMARTVSLPAAIGSKLILQGKIKETGVLIPVQPDIYNPILDELENMNIICVEKEL